MYRRAFLVCTLLVMGKPVSGQQQPSSSWTFRTRLVLSGNSDESTPPGYVVYSGIGLEAAITRRIGKSFGMEFSLRTESREVDYEPPGGERERLGSLELLPLNFLVQFRPATGGRLKPYAGAGISFTPTWEKSGVLDSMDVGSHTGPALQLGADIELSGSVLFNVDLRWNTLTADVENAGAPFTSLKIDPIAFALGVGFRF